MAALQSVSMPHVRSPSAAGSHTSFDEESDVRTHACPIAVSHIASAVQNFGHDLAFWHSLLPPP
jgi:hypothetical protein